MPNTSILTRAATKVARSALGGLALTTALIVATPTAIAQDGDAKAILKAMADFVSSQQTIALSFDSAIEIITPEIEKIQFTNSGEMLLSRPNQLKASRTGGYADVELVFDGKTVSILGKNLNGYAQFEGPDSVDALIEQLRTGQGIALPGADLLLSNAYEALSAGIIEAKHIGRGVIGGIDCEHLAFRNADTDWQLWVEAGEQPIPRQLVITSKTLAAAPQYSLRITDWSTGIAPSADAFSFVPPEGADTLDPNALIELDELPPPAPVAE